MLQAIGYIRRSTDRQEESLDQQRAKLEGFALAKGWQLVKVYVDDAISGSDLERPGLLDLMRRAESDKQVHAVVAWDRNRLARPRDPIDGLMLERRLLAAGKRVLYAGSGQEADKSIASDLTGYFEHRESGNYLRKLSRDTMRGTTSRAQQGLWPGGPIPFGYDRLILGADGEPKRIVRDMEDGSQVVMDPASGEVVERVGVGLSYTKQEHEACSLIPSDPARVRAVQKLFADYAAGKPGRVLREELNASGFRTSRGNVFTIPTILPILESPAYLGQCVYNRRTLSEWHRHTGGASVEREGKGVEKRPASDWVVTENAWPAIIDRATFDQVKARRQVSKEKHRAIIGRAVKGEYQLTGLFFCGVCGAKMMGQTCTSGKGYRTRYYTCNAHHRGKKEQCPKRYTVPADVVESRIWALIREDLAKLRDDDKLQVYVAKELERVNGRGGDARGQLQRRLAELDQQLAQLREHVLAMGPDAAKSLGLYDRAKDLGQERQSVEAELGRQEKRPELPGPAELRKRIAKAFDRLERVLADGTLEERRDVLALYVQTIKAEPDHQSIRVGLYSPLFTSGIAGAGFEPATSGL
ncbi:MAG: recombinase family protein [Planctomycetota bacterium]|nr:recombinase family protein [Planctomycetota bacterium]